MMIWTVKRIAKTEWLKSFYLFKYEPSINIKYFRFFNCDRTLKQLFIRLFAFDA